ncbi:MAG: hypothetical protein IPH21_18450 [Flavobacteriales bacterium]|nr:hypothetical protein [Flavobacteriales bacterium]MBK9534523.1 hypothetical protein [Flavobacteriales bacterium]HQX31830.1 hypothetical protein [Flavobacteriales bacterium]
MKDYLKVAFLFFPFCGFAQENTKPVLHPSDPENVLILPNALTLQVLMTQCPKGMPELQWKEIMQNPVNASLYPIHVTHALLDTIDASQLDPRHQYVMVEE